MNPLQSFGKSRLKRSVKLAGFVGALLASHLAVANEIGGTDSGADSVIAPLSPTRAMKELALGILVFDAESKQLVTKDGETTADFIFSYKNVSADSVLFEKIVTSCGCTVTSVQCPLTVKAGESGSIPVTLDVAGKRGIIMKSVTIETNRGSKVLSIQATIPQEIGGQGVHASGHPVAEGSTPVTPLGPRNISRRAMRMAATRNRQSVFEGDCASCHVTPAVGKFGKDLYVSACGICHEAKHRATMVTDLRTLPHPMGSEFWRKAITSGVPNSLMPAFAETEGGPLSLGQVESLVKFLAGEFPAPRN